MSARCPLCGTAFDPAAAAGCAGCPLASNCTSTCCPACGYSWVEPEQTVIGRFLARWLRPAPAACPQPPVPSACPDPRPTLADIRAPALVRVAGCERLPEDRRRQLRAFGLTDGGVIRLLQQSPATVIAVGRAEVALEADLARCIHVEAVTVSGTQ